VVIAQGPIITLITALSMATESWLNRPSSILSSLRDPPNRATGVQDRRCDDDEAAVRRMMLGEAARTIAKASAE